MLSHLWHTMFNQKLLHMLEWVSRCIAKVNLALQSSICSWLWWNASLGHFSICKYNCCLYIWPCGAYLWCTMPLEFKETINMTLILLYIWHGVSGHGEEGNFYSNDCRSVW